MFWKGIVKVIYHTHLQNIILHSVKTIALFVRALAAQPESIGSSMI